MDGKSKKEWLSASLILAVTPFLGYLMLTAFEMGVASYFNIPFEWIVLSFSSLCTAVLVEIVLMTLILFVIQLLIYFAPSWFWGNTAIARAIRIFTFVSAPLLFSACFLVVTRQDLFYLVGSFVSFICLVLIVLFFTHRDKKGLEQKFLALQVPGPKSSGEMIMQNLMGREGFKIFFTCVYGIIFSSFLMFNFGQAHAKGKGIFWVISGTDKVVLRMYGDYMICGELDRAIGEVTKIERIKQSGDNPVILVHDTTGRLKFKGYWVNVNSTNKKNM